MLGRLTKIWLRLTVAMAAVVGASSCMKWDYGDTEDFAVNGRGLFICNEGNFQYSNGSLSYYDPATGVVLNEVFFRANGYRLGDVVQSMTVRGQTGWIVVNNSHVVFAIDVNTFKEKGRIENLTSPRYIHFVDDTKVYITQLWDNRIFIVDPRSYEITGYITVPGMERGSGSTEQMVSYGKYVYCNCWSYQNRIIKIDTETDRVVGELTVGMQPNSLVMDCNEKLWVMCDGGYEGSPLGNEAPSLYRIDAATFEIEQRYRFRSTADVGHVTINGRGDRLYWIDRDVWAMDVSSVRLPVRPLIQARDTKYYGLTVDPVTDEIYLADAIDYQQQGVVYRYSPSGSLIAEFFVGVTPGAYAWCSARPCGVNCMVVPWNDHSTHPSNKVVPRNDLTCDRSDNRINTHLSR